VVKAVGDGLADRYGAVPGLPKLQEAICNKLREVNGIPTEPEQIVVTVGASEALSIASLLLIEPGDVVMMLSPSYPSHIESVILAGGRVAYVPLLEADQWRFEAEALSIAWEHSLKEFEREPKVLILCDPLNPTGSCLSWESLSEIADFALKHELWVITDEVYEDYCFEGNTHFSLGCIQEMRPRIISCFSLSKAYAMPGWRVGYLVADASLSRSAVTIHDQVAVCVPLASQYAALAALSTPKEWLSGVRETVISSRQALVEGFSRLKFFLLAQPTSGLFGFPAIRGASGSVQFVEQIAEEAGVLLFPGLGFGPSGEGHVRVSFGVQKGVLEEAIERLNVWETRAPE